MHPSHGLNGSYASAYSNGRWPEVLLEEITPDLLQARFWPTGKRVIVCWTQARF